MSTPRERDARNEIVRYSQLVYQKGWVANHDGNLTARVSRGRIVATPTGVSKGDVCASNLIVVNDQGERVSGTHRPFSEISLHLTAYQRREDIQAVIHAHPPFATAMACAGVELGRPALAEAIVSLGHHIPLADFAAPKTPAFTRVLEPLIDHHDVVVMTSHGVLALGSSLEQAFLRLELVEHLAKISTHARSWGGTRALPDEVVKTLLETRKRAGLGPEARGLSLSPRLSSPSASAATQHPSPSSDLARLITEEIAAVLSETQRGS